MDFSTNIHVTVYQVLDAVIGAGFSPPGAKARIHHVIDYLRGSHAPSELIDLAETIGIRLHQLEWALARRDEAAEAEAMQGFRRVATEWLNFRIVN